MAAYYVSIRSRLLGREIQVEAAYQRVCMEFQSAPGFWAGRYNQYWAQNPNNVRFQSAPGFWAGRYATLSIHGV